MTLPTLIEAIQKSLTPDLLKPQYRAKNKGNPLYGHCYTASEALYHLLKQHFPLLNYKPCRGRDTAGVVHWWLVDNDGNILDPTADQYLRVGCSPPYHAGKKAGFLTSTPSKRAQTVMDRLSHAPLSL